jgi:hypothetical protein
MPEMVLPGVFIEVRAEALITPGPITVGNIGIVGTASQGPLGEVRSLGSFAEAREVYGPYDAWVDGGHKELSLVRALELAYENGASTVFAARVTSTVNVAPATTAVAQETWVPAWNLWTTARKASFDVPGESAATAVAITLRALSPGTWGNSININVMVADDDTVVSDDAHAAGATPKLRRSPIADDPRNRLEVTDSTTGQKKPFTMVFAPAAAAPGKVLVDKTTGALTFAAADIPKPADMLAATYVVPSASCRKVTLTYQAIMEVYSVVDGNHLKQLVNDPLAKSQLVEAVTPASNSAPNDRPKPFANADDVRPLTNGSNGEDAAQSDYALGLAQLLSENAHIILAAGRDETGDQLTGIGSLLKAHVDAASTDKIKRDRIGVLGSPLGATLPQITAHNIASDRIVFVAPGIKTTDASAKPKPKQVTLPGSYAAAAIAGLISALDPQQSLTNKTVAVDGLEKKFTPDKLEQLVQARVLALEEHQGLRVVRGITTDPGAFQQITTRRIVDYAKYGVRGAAEPFIGLLNNDRVRKALKGAINGFLARMVDDEMLESYELDVTATRAEEISGIARVVMTLRPTFSIDYIVVTMFLS